VEHFQRCVEIDPKYSAAWKLLGKAHQALENYPAARQAWEQGLEAAKAHGDKQARRNDGIPEKARSAGALIRDNAGNAFGIHRTTSMRTRRAGGQACTCP
jgi:tetratricopeptide (TPR) repeat protein